jgi:hypothetical protein
VPHSYERNLLKRHESAKHRMYSAGAVAWVMGECQAGAWRSQANKKAALFQGGFVPLIRR